jgi:DNA-binding MarR family transcriptional regulator
LVAIEQAVGFLVRSQRRREASFRQRAGALGLGLERPNYQVLVALTDGPLMSVSDLARVCEVDHSTMSRRVSQLLNAHLIEKVSDARDRRVILLKPSQKGVELRALMAKSRHENLDEMLVDWSEDERRELASTLTRFVTTVQEHHRRRGTLGDTPIDELD